MSDDGQEPTTQPTTESTPPSAQPTEPAEPKTFDETYVKSLRDEAAKHRKELRSAQKQLKDLQTAQEAARAAELEAQGQWKELAEQNAQRTAQLEAQLAEQESKLNIERRNTMAVSIATALGAIDPTDANFTSAVSEIDISADDAQGQIKEALEALKEARPYLFGSGKPNLAPFNPATGETQPATETAAQRRQRIYGGGASRVFDPKAAQERGGGVVYTQTKTE
jgi:multidrug efflux pump subunit AcrA (membrane-fusion protein)